MRTSFQIMMDTIHALTMREVKTRFGANRLGYFWALAEPMAGAMVLAVLFSLMGRSQLTGVPVAIFMVAGLLPFQMFSKMLTQVGAAVKSNKALFTYRQVIPLDAVITRVMIEAATYFVVFALLLLGFAWYGFDAAPDDPMALILASLLLMIFSAGLGMVLCVLTTFWEDIGRVVGMLTRPLFFLSGVFFCATMIPSQYWGYLDWNPIFHAIELSRAALFVSYETPIGSWVYVSASSLVSVMLGLLLFRLYRQRFVAR